MHKRISKILICSLFILTILCSWSVDAFAATVFDPWKDDKPSWYSYGYNQTASLPMEIYCKDGSSVSIKTLPYDDDGSISRTIDGVTYSTSTYVYKSSGTISNPYIFQVSDITAWGWSDGIVDMDSPPIYSFTDLDLYYLVNVYGQNAVLYTGDDLYLSAVYSRVTLANETGVGKFDLELDCDVVASTKYSAASTTYIVHVSYHSDTEILFELDDEREESYLTIMIGSSGTAPMCSTLTDVDFGFIDGRIGIAPLPYSIDIWGNVKLPPQVIYHISEESNLLPAYDVINSSLLVTTFLVPLGSIAMSFFLLREVLWKG